MQYETHAATVGATNPDRPYVIGLTVPRIGSYTYAVTGSLLAVRRCWRYVSFFVQRSDTFPGGIAVALVVPKRANLSALGYVSDASSILHIFDNFQTVTTGVVQGGNLGFSFEGRIDSDYGVAIIIPANQLAASDILNIHGGYEP